MLFFVLYVSHITVIFVMISMKQFLTILLVVFVIFPVLSQETNEPKKDITLDLRYREDQFYFGITYNLLGKIPDNVSQNGFSSGFQIGFVRDMPINKKRTFAIGLGLGYAINSFNQNISIVETQNNYSYTVLDNSQFTKNRMFQHLLEVPFEIRIRKSSSAEHKFFRIHTGFKVGYLIYNSYRFKGDGKVEKLKNIDDFNNIQYALTSSLGYNTWNFYVQYGLNPIFNSDVTIDGKSIDMNTIKIGLIFYIL